MAYHDYRYAEAEFGVDGLVAEDIHASPCSQTAANDGKSQQRGFGDSAAAVARQEFVYAKRKEGSKVDEGCVKDEVVCVAHGSERSAKALAMPLRIRKRGKNSRVCPAGMSRCGFYSLYGGNSGSVRLSR